MVHMAGCVGASLVMLDYLVLKYHCNLFVVIISDPGESVTKNLSCGISSPIVRKL